MSISRKIERKPSAALQQWWQSPAGLARIARHKALYQRYNASTRSELAAAMGREESKEAIKSLCYGPAWPLPEPHSAHGNPPQCRYAVQEIVACLEAILAGPLEGSFDWTTYSPEPEQVAARAVQTARLRDLLRRYGASHPRELVAKMGASEVATTLFALLAGPGCPIPEPHSMTHTEE